jgi:threonine/homoserine/homoserine lactone efflux protein
MIDWSGFLVAGLLVSLIPGANQLLGLGNAVKYGTGRALAGVAARLVALAVLIGLVVGGLGAVLAASATALEVVKWFGVVYLAWLGIAGLRSALKAPHASHAAVTSSRGVRSIMVHEFAVAISNPKALLLFAAVLPQFTDASAPGAGLNMALLGAVYLVIELLVGFGYIAVGRGLGATGIPARTQRRVDAGSGVVFLGMAGLLAAEDLA